MCFQLRGIPGRGGETDAETGIFPGIAVFYANDHSADAPCSSVTALTCAIGPTSQHVFTSQPRSLTSASAFGEVNSNSPALDPDTKAHNTKGRTQIEGV